MARAEVRYLQMPSVDESASARFYEQALGWTTRTRGDGSTAFDDTAAGVSGEWVRNRMPAGDTGVLLYVMVDDVDAALAKIIEAGGEIVVPPTREGESLVYATFRDPSGNVLGVFHDAGS